MIGCECAVCRSTDPRDKRTRPSIVIEIKKPGPEDPAYKLLGRDETPHGPKDPAYAGSAVAEAVRYILVDTSTDLRAQALANGMTRVDAILFTHSHADHILGLDEVR